MRLFEIHGVRVDVPFTANHFTARNYRLIALWGLYWRSHGVVPVPSLCFSVSVLGRAPWWVVGSMSSHLYGRHADQETAAERCLMCVVHGIRAEAWTKAPQQDVEALARYLFAHPELRAFLESQRRSGEPMGWVNLACQHLPITASARQRLLEATAAERCTKISRGLDALLRKEQQA